MKANLGTDETPNISGSYGTLFNDHDSKNMCFYSGFYGIIYLNCHFFIPGLSFIRHGLQFEP